LINWGILPLLFVDPADYAQIEQGDKVEITGTPPFLKGEGQLIVHNVTKAMPIPVKHDMSTREVNILLAGGLLRQIGEKHAPALAA
jgi:aconitate hydratase